MIEIHEPKTNEKASIPCVNFFLFIFSLILTVSECLTVRVDTIKLLFFFFLVLLREHAKSLNRYRCIPDNLSVNTGCNNGTTIQN